MGKKNQRKTTQITQGEQPVGQFSRHLINFKGQPLPKEESHPSQRRCHYIDLDMSEKRISCLDIEESGKDFMNLWNSYLIQKDLKIQRNLILADKHDASISLIGFIAEHGEKIRQNFMKHFFMHVLVLYEYGYLTKETLLRSLERVNPSFEGLVKREMKEFTSDKI